MNLTVVPGGNERAERQRDTILLIFRQRKDTCDGVPFLRACLRGQKLHVEGSILSSDGTATGGSFLLGRSGNSVLSASSGSLLIINGAGYTNVSINGNVGIGQTSPDQGKVEVKGGTVCVDTDSDDNASSCIANESDERLKENVETLTNSLDTILALRGVSFDWRATDANVLAHYPLLSRYASTPRSVGLIAQEVQRVVPEAISSETVGDAEVQYLQLDYFKLIPHIIEAIKELAGKVGETAHLIIDKLTARRVETQELCVDDVCITRDQFAEVFGNQSAAAGAPGGDGHVSTPGGSSAEDANPNADASTTTTPAKLEPITSGAANDNGLALTDVEDADQAEEPEPATAANDNQPAEDLTATGTE